MLRSRAAVGVIVLLGVTLAGCVGGDGGTESVQTQAAPEPVVDEDTGSIVGLVTDDTLLPLEGAQVALTELNLGALTDAVGAFTINNVTPGSHAVFVQKLGYESAAQRVTVAAGTVTELTIDLDKLPVAEPWVQVDTHSGHLDWGVRVVPAVGGRASGDIIHDWEHGDRTDAMEAMFIEQVWTGTQPLAGGMRLRVEVDGESNNLDRTWCVLEGKSPSVCAADKEQIDFVLGNSGGPCDEEECRSQWRGFTGTGNTGQDVDFGIMVDQDFTVYVSMFYRQPMPPNYQARPDA